MRDAGASSDGRGTRSLRLGSRSRAVRLALLFVVALTARVAVYAIGSDQPTQDEVAYGQLATEIASGNGFARQGRPETHIAPLFPLLHALPVALGADPHTTGRGLGLLTSALAAPLLAWALSPLLGRRWWMVAGLLVALHPRLLVTAERIQPEALAAMLLLLFCGWWIRDRPWGVAVAAVLAYLARPEAVVLLPLVGILVIANESGTQRRWLGPALLALVIAAPYLLHLRQATGHWVVTGKARWVYALGVAEARDGNEPIAVEALRRIEDEVESAWTHARRQPLAAAKGYLRRLGYGSMYLGSAVWWPFLALSLAGLAGLAGGKQRVGGLLIPLALLLVIPVGVVHARHVLPYVPLLLGAAVCGLEWLAARGRRPVGRAAGA